MSDLKLMIIKTASKVLVSDNIKGEGYFNSRIDCLYFDGEQPKNTFKKDWFEIKNVPTKIQKKRTERKVNQRYELKEGFNETELTPKVINKSYIDDDSEYYEVKGLYNYKYETEEAGFEDVEFEIHLIEELEGEFEITTSQYSPQYNLLDRIQTHSILLELKPCKLTKEETYKIIRSHVKANINPKYAKVSSDYDFCFTVEKVLELHEPETYFVDVNAGYSRRKPKHEKRYKTSRTMKVYEAAPKSYQNYPLVKEFEGKNLEDLKNNVAIFLDNLMEQINEPIKDCEACKGRGVIVNGSN